MIMRAMEHASRLAVQCGGCGRASVPERVLGIVVKPQHDVQPYAIVEYRCRTPDCGYCVPLEVDL